MLWIIQLFSLVSSACGNFAATPTVYEAEEDENLTITWDSQNQTDLSLTNMICFSVSNPQKVLYDMIDGVESLKSRHQQFIGRVECDRVALREGRVRLHLSRLRAEDSGSYRCELEANYDRILKRWELVATVKFVLIVTSHGKSPESLNTPKPEPADTGGATVWQERFKAAAVLAVLGFLGFLGFLGYFAVTRNRHRRRYRDQNEAQRTIIQLLFHMINTMSPITQSDTAEESYINCFRDETTPGRTNHVAANDLSSNCDMEVEQLV
ncbi:uncharacterized protein PAE49_021841 isoform 1-T3 [Odontesthes bonariensis]|uniref:uncharacterized protein LOC142368385 n=1 Tax=Odontesthes bonariensis TaxID=219752 RepID=UPI003F588794